MKIESVRFYRQQKTKKMKEKELKETYGTVPETIQGLATAGYTHTFIAKDECLLCHQKNSILSTGDFQIDKVYRFDNDPDPGSPSAIYAITALKDGVKGILVMEKDIFYTDTSATMREKLNIAEYSTIDATQQRPDGERIVNAPLVEMNLNRFIEQIKNEKSWADSDRNSVTIFKSETMRIVLIGLHQDAELKPHKANGTLSIQVLDGKLEFMTEQQITQIERGQMIAVQDNVAHSVKALTASFFLLTLAFNSK